LTPPSLRYKIGLIADLGKDSKTKNGTFMSYLREGHLIVRRNHGAAQNESSHNVTVEFKEDVGVQMLETGLNNAGRGFDLSTLNVFNGDLYTCDDQTGIVYKLGTAEGENVTATPWVILPNPEGNGTRNTFKCEWATVKDNELWIGSLGTALDKDGNEVNDRLCIRKLSPDGFVTTVDWTQNYEQLGKALDIDIRTGFVAHESGAWSDLLQKWVFLPRRVSEQKFDQATINNIGSNVALLADDQFSNVEVKTLGELNEKSGFTSFKFIPDSEDQLILALKAETEEKGKTGSFLAVYDLEGKEIMEPVRIADGIYAGVEFL
jgi:soluble calcium-activated nucleotidase 1